MQYSSSTPSQDSTDGVQFIGIDFGTYKCAMFRFDPQKREVRIIRNAEGEETTPSLVYYGEQEVLVGSPVLDMLEDSEQAGNVITSVKRDLATQRYYPVPGEPTPVQAATEIFRKLKRDAEASGYFDGEVTHTVVTYPATFNQLEQDTLVVAAKFAGFREVRLLEEPEAAAIAFVQEGYRPGNCVLVYDLGAGTFDLSLLVRDTQTGDYHSARLSDGLRLGGDDFDLALYEYCEQLCMKQHGRSISTTDETNLKFLNDCRKKKVNLSKQRQTVFSWLLPDPQKGVIQLRHNIDVDTFEGLIQQLVQETVTRTQKFFERARNSGYSADTIVLIGGSSQVPLVKRLLQEVLPVEPQHWDQRHLAVALGAAYFANELWGIDRQVKQYKQALDAARIEGTWQEATVKQLADLSRTLGLTSSKAEQIEREVLGLTLDDTVKRQIDTKLDQYRLTIKSVWHTGKKSLEAAEVDLLVRIAKQLGLTAKQSAAAEWEIMKDTKEKLRAAPTVMVSQDGQGQFQSISEAIDQSPVNAKILVQPGHYTESLILGKPLEIIGVGSREDIIIEGVNVPCILMQTDTAKVSGLTLQTCTSGQKKYFAVDIPRGRLELHGCDITSDSLACVGIHGPAADPIIHKCMIHDGKQSGVLIDERGKGLLEECDIFGNEGKGIEIKTGSNPTIQRCRIYDGREEGIMITKDGQGMIENCDIFANFDEGIEIREGGNPLIRHCKMYGGQDNGLVVEEDGKGTIENCDIYGSPENYPNVWIGTEGNPILRRCKIHSGKNDGVFIGTSGRGTIEDCNIFDNSQAGVHICQGKDPVIRRCKINRNGTEAIWMHEDATAKVEFCDLSSNTRGAWDIGEGCRIEEKGNTPNTAGVLQILRQFGSQSDFYIYPDIPDYKLTNAKDKCNVPNEEQILGLVDCTFWGSAKDCVLFGTEGIYHHMVGNLGKILYSDFPDCVFVCEDSTTVIARGAEERISTVTSTVSAWTLCKILDAIQELFQ